MFRDALFQKARVHRVLGFARIESRDTLGSGLRLAAGVVGPRICTRGKLAGLDAPGQASTLPGMTDLLIKRPKRPRDPAQVAAP
jgi:hypothetical protein